MRPPLDRAVFPVIQRWAYLNHASIGPLPQVAVDAMASVASETAASGSVAVKDHELRVEEVRAAAARVMDVPTTDVAFVKNTTEGLGFVANGLTWRPGDRIVLPDLEFPSTAYPFLALRDQGVVVDLVRPEGPGGALSTRAFAEVIASGPPPRLVVTSWVQFARGWRTDLAALAAVTHDAGALLCADVIQGLGVVPAHLDAWGVDFAMADAHKWLLGPEGIGLFYVRESCRHLLRPLEPGWNSVLDRKAWENMVLVYDDSARRFEGGTHNVAGIAGLGASLGVLDEGGIGNVWQHVRDLCDRACDGLSDLGLTVLSDRSPEGRSGIVSAQLPVGDPELLAEALIGAGVVCAARSGTLRVAPHGYNTADEVHALLSAVASWQLTRQASLAT